MIATEILEGSLTKNSFQNYNRSINYYKDFLALYFPASSVLPISLEYLVLFIAYCMHRQLSFNTVSSYVSMLNYVQKMAGFPDLSKSFVIKKCLEGFRKKKARADTRLPITPAILKRLVESLTHLGFSKFLQILLKAMYLMAFHAFLRVGEITSTSSSPKNIISFTSVNFLLTGEHPFAVLLDMSHFKHHTGKSCHKFQINCNVKNVDLCPVHAVWEYCKMRGIQNGPLFCFMDGKPIPRQYFTRQLQLSLQWAGCDTAVYKGHSFRIGAASSAAMMGISSDNIQLMGRWHSDAYKKYIRIPVLNI